MPAQFSVRFVLAVFGGAALGLLVGVVARYLLHANWNVFAVMPWGIMAAVLAVTFSYVLKSERGKKGDPT